MQLSSPNKGDRNVNKGSEEELKTATGEIVRAVLNMAKRDFGALIVITQGNIAPHILESGTRLDADISGQLIESVFNPKGALHDGAVFIRGNKILAAGCFLNLSQSHHIDKELGTRHRAAIGISESSNVTAIVVSEETGVISVAKDGMMRRYFDGAMLTKVIEEIYGLRGKTSDGRRRIKMRGEQDEEA